MTIMWIRNSVYILWIFIHSSGQITADYIEYFYHLDNRFADILPISDILWSQTEWDIIRCGIECLQTSTCISVFHDGSSCHAYLYRMHKAIPIANKTNMRYYEPKGIYGNVAENKPAQQSSTLVLPILGTYNPEKAVDGGRDPWPILPDDSCAIANPGNSWWRVDLLKNYNIYSVAILPRSQSHAGQIANVAVYVLEKVDGTLQTCLTTTGPSGWLGHFQTFVCPTRLYGRYIQIMKTHSDSEYLCLCEVEVYV